MKIYNIELPSEFHSGNGVSVERATIKRERMEEILRAAIEADRQCRGISNECEPVEQQIRYFDSNALSRTYGEWSEWKMFTGKYERMGMNQKRGLITTDQAEAMVKQSLEALEEAGDKILKLNTKEN